MPPFEYGLLALEDRSSPPPIVQPEIGAARSSKVPDAEKPRADKNGEDAQRDGDLGREVIDRALAEDARANGERGDQHQDECKREAAGSDRLHLSRSLQLARAHE